MDTVLIAFFKQHLHAQAYAQQRFPFGRLLSHGFIHTGSAEFFRRVLESAYAGKQQPVCPADFLNVVCHNRFLSDCGKGRPQGKQIPHAVVDDCDHHRTPFVEGISSAQAGSIATAVRRLRATLLNAPSIM